MSKDRDIEDALQAIANVLARCSPYAAVPLFDELESLKKKNKDASRLITPTVPWVGESGTLPKELRP